MEVVSILGLLALNAYQLWYWSKVNSRLVDKIMCRNYAEYVQVTSTQSNLPQDSIKVPSEDDQEETEILRELNGMIGA